MPKCCLYCRVDGASTESNRLAMNQQLTALPEVSPASLAFRFPLRCSNMRAAWTRTAKAFER